MMMTTTKATAETNNNSAATRWSASTRAVQEGANDSRVPLSGPLATQCVESGCQIAALVAAARATRPIRHG